MVVGLWGWFVGRELGRENGWMDEVDGVDQVMRISAM